MISNVHEKKFTPPFDYFSAVAAIVGDKLIHAARSQPFIEKLFAWFGAGFFTAPVSLSYSSTYGIEEREKCK